MTGVSQHTGGSHSSDVVEDCRVRNLRRTDKRNQSLPRQLRKMADQASLTHSLVKKTKGHLILIID